MRHLITFENKQSIIEEHILYSMFNDIHHTDDDFIDGDLGERIEKYNSYQLVKINLENDIDLEEWFIDDFLVDKYMDEIRESPETTPMCLIDSDFSIIDGTHRLNAFYNLSFKNIFVYKGMSLISY